MYAITGITGQVGGAAAQALLAAGHPIRAILRDAGKAASWAAQGAEIAIAEFEDEAALASAFTGVTGVFAMIPPYFAPAEDFPEARAIVAALRQALAATTPPKIVALSSIGAQHADGLGLITQLHILEEQLGSLPIPIAFLRAGWFMENAAWDIEPAHQTGKMASFLQPLDRHVPMIATADIGRIAAKALLEDWTGRRILEIEGPKRYSPNEAASLLGAAIGRPVSAYAVPRDQWEALFRAQGTAWPAPRIAMLDGFNSGWIDFEGEGCEHVLGEVPFEDVLQALAARARK